MSNLSFKDRKSIVDSKKYLKIKIMNRNIEFYRKILSAKLMDTNEENHPSEGIIYFKFNGQDDYVEIDDLEIKYLNQIIKEL